MQRPLFFSHMYTLLVTWDYAHCLYIVHIFTLCQGIALHAYHTNWCITASGSLARFLYSTTPAEPSKFGAAGHLGGCGEGESILSFIYLPFLHSQRKGVILLFILATRSPRTGLNKFTLFLSDKTSCAVVYVAKNLSWTLFFFGGGETFSALTRSLISPKQ